MLRLLKKKIDYYTSKTFKYILIIYTFIYVSYFIVQTLEANSGYFDFWILRGNMTGRENYYKETKKVTGGELKAIHQVHGSHGTRHLTFQL